MQSVYLDVVADVDAQCAFEPVRTAISLYLHHSPAREPSLMVAKAEMVDMKAD